MSYFEVFEKVVKDFGVTTEDALAVVAAVRVVGSKRYDHIQMPKESEELRARICTQCGAPLHGHKCEYCGTEYI